MKKIISALTILSVVLSCFLPTTVLANDEFLHNPDDEILNDKSSEETIYTLSLEDAIELAMKDNPQVVANVHMQTANELNIKNAQLTKSATKDSLKKASAFGIMSATTIEEICVKNGYYVNAARLQYDLGVMEAERIKASIAYNTTNSYCNVVLMDKLVNAAQNSYNLAIENKSVVETQYQLGLVAQMTYENADIAVAVAKSMLDAYKLSREIAEINLKNNLNIDINSTLILTDEIECEQFTSNAEMDAQSAMNTRYDITAAKKQAELAYEYFDLTGAFTERSAVYNTAYASYINAEYSYSSAVKSINLLIRSSYNTICTNHSSMDIAKRTYEMKLREYDAAKLKYELGMVSNLELTDTINALYEAEVDYVKAKLDYKMSVEKYKYDITIGLPM